MESMTISATFLWFALALGSQPYAALPHYTPPCPYCIVKHPGPGAPTVTLAVKKAKGN